ncbi:hypothetical protein [Marinicella litoralis]|uniref:Uncharacterized protein n=1 Tax=Marinicella litoralis TaxID=644220 RepID=A0A4R6XLS4_9GAMM|nr:hypothetical protein [Marinicella litoralis]TDR20585.1 hypothetical protein C8D91_1559 [Marinicella litoralis]
MNILKNILGTLFLIFGLFTIVLYLLGIFSIDIGGYQIPMGRNFSTEFWGYISAVLLLAGGYMLIKNNLVSRWLLIGSVIFYILGATMPHWSSHGFGVFNYLMNQFYVSLSVRVLLTVLAIYAIHKVIADNKSVQSTPKGALDL